MKQIGSLAAICAALLFVSLCVGLMTAGPAIAQGGGSNRDVRVVNTAAESIPTNITNVPAVQVNSLPAVQISSLPAVQVGNNSGNPVPVNVTNLPAVQTPPEPKTFLGDFTMFAGISSRTFILMTVPSGKRLVIDFVSFGAEDAPGVSHGFKVRVDQSPQNNLLPECYVNADGRVGGRDSGSEMVIMNAVAGDRVVVDCIRDDAGVDSRWSLLVEAHLVDAP